MAGNNHQQLGIATLVRRVARTGWGALQNRLELFVVEWHEERIRMAQVFVWSVALVFLAMLGVLLVTGTIIFLFREDLRLYVAAAFAVLYLAGAIVAAFGLRSLLKREPFADTIDQMKKDRTWLESLE